MKLDKKLFGKSKSGMDVYEYTIENEHGMSVKVIEYGATVTSIRFTASGGNLRETVLGYDTLEDYENGDAFFGAAVGRVANRIEGSIIKLGGKDIKLNANEGENCLHGGICGFDKKTWSSEPTASGVRFIYKSGDNEENFPGELNVIVEYSLTDENELRINYKAVTDKLTMVSLTNHSYFNLGEKTESAMMKHKVRLNADYFTPINEEFIPTGEVVAVAGTPFDFKELKDIGRDIDNDDTQLGFAGGYDHNFVVNRPKNDNKSLMYAATLRSEESGIEMNVYTTMPGIQFYSGNNLHGENTRDDGTEYERRCGVCFETQFFPSAQKFPSYVQPILEPGELYEHTTVYSFKKIYR